MSEECNASSHVRDFLAGLKTNANLPNLKTVVGKLNSLPGASQFKGIQIQLLRVQSELLKGQLMILDQIIQGLESAPEQPAPAEQAAPEPTGNGKIVVS